MENFIKKTTLIYIFFLCFLFSYSQNAKEAIAQLKDETGAKITINQNNGGVAKFVRFPINNPLDLQGNNVEEKVTSFLNEYKSIFSIKNSIESTLQVAEVKTDNYGLKSVIMKQMHNNVPIFDGLLKFHFNKDNKLTSINGNYIPYIKISSIPTLSENEANEIAIEEIENQDINRSGKELKIITTKLYIFQKGLVEGVNAGNYLVYEVEVRNDLDVREFLYINANNGEIVEQFTGIAHVIDRILYEGNTSNVTWTEGDEFPGTLDQWQQNELVGAEHIYNFFKNTFNFISYDNADTQMKTINNNPEVNCPNASWNGVTANYCDGTASDDIVAHEWAHAYTQYTSGLIYRFQSGALNESYSDIWGETIDILNEYEDEDEDLSIRTNCNNSQRWLIGEDASAFGGSIRDMRGPNCLGDPYAVTSAEYRCYQADNDNGGVHFNSGVPNFAYAVLVDGNSSVAAIGFVKAAHIFWRVQNTYLTQTSNFIDFADALEAACADLIGVDLEGISVTETPAGISGELITTEDCEAVANAIAQTDMRVPVSEVCETALNTNTDPLCEASTTNPLFYEDWESGMGDWTVEQIPENASTWEPRDWVITSSLPNERTGQGIFGTDPINGNCTSDFENGIIRLQSPVITLPNITTGDFEMSFNHYFATEGGWDGGNLKYSLDGGSWTLIPTSAFTVNPYNSSLNTTGEGNDNPMEGESAFSGSNLGSPDGSWAQSTINLSTLGATAESTIQFRWEMGTDGCNGNDGWYLDEIVVYNCTASLSVSEYNSMIEGVQISPNPSDGIFIINKTSSLELINAKIYNLNGSLLKELDLTNMNLSKEVNLSDLSQGIYIISITSNNSKGSMKIIKQ